MNQETSKPVIGLTCGDINGIGIEIIIKSLSDSRIMEICTPVIYANNKAVNFYRKSIESNFQFSIVREDGRFNPKQPNIFNVWTEEALITPGKMDENAGKYAFLSLKAAVNDLKEKKIDGIVTAPIHKKTIQSKDFNYSGHTPFLRDSFAADDVAMLMIVDNMRVAVLTEHIPVAEIAKHVVKEIIVKKLEIIHKSLVRDFGIDKPRIAVLGLNPHAGDEGLIGDEEIKIIQPAIAAAKQKSILAFGTYSADAFFAHALYNRFDAVLAMYHDQGLIPFKSLAQGEGINYTAGLPIVRTSPDHGTAFDIAGKNTADASSFQQAIFSCIDILRQRKNYDTARENPVQRRSSRVIANLEDEKVEE